MNRLANVLVSSTSAKRLNRLMDLLTDHNYTVLVCETASQLRSEALSSEPDLVLMDMDNSDFDPLDVANQFSTSTETEDIPIVFIADRSSNIDFDRCYEVGAEDVLLEPLADSELLLRLAPLLRLSTMHAELHRRMELAQRFGADGLRNAKPQSDKDPAKALYVGPSAATRDVITQFLGSDAHFGWTEDTFEAEEMMMADFMDVAVIEVSGDGDLDACLDLCERMRANPRLFNLPVVFLLPQGLVEDTTQFFQAGATRVFESPWNDSEFGVALKCLIRRQRLRWAIRKAIDTTRVAETTDDLTGAYSWEFLKAHSSILINAAQNWSKYLTLVFFSVPNVPDVRMQFGDEAADHLMQQLAQWISNLIRAEDLAARYGDHDFCVALPDTPQEEAEIVMQRIAGIISYTDFALHEVYQPITVWVEVGIAQLSPDDTVDTLIARARQKLD